MDIFSNAVFVSVLVMVVLCVLRLNVLLSIIISAVIAGLLSTNLVANYEAAHSIVSNDSSLLHSFIITGKILIDGMAKNLNVALSYILIGAMAAAIARTNLMLGLLNIIANCISDKKYVFILSIAFFSCFSQNLIPVHIAFIPILIPPLLALMNKLRIDRRAVACALTFGLQAPYVALGVGFGLIFHTIIKEQMEANGVIVSLSDISSVMWIGGLAMLFGLFIAVFVLYNKPRIYEDSNTMQLEKAKMGWREYVMLFSIITTFAVQLITESLPLGAFTGLVIMIALRGVKWGEVDSIMEDGLRMMAFIAFVMLVAAGYGEILRQSGEVNMLVSSLSSVGYNKILSAALMLFIGFLITMGIGTSFGTIPIIATIYVPLGISLGFSSSAIILLIGIAGALGDAGSPASDSTLGPTSGLNADSKHDHIRDTCIPTFLVYNTSLLIFGVIGAVLLG